jgi:hypothetical protein
MGRKMGDAMFEEFLKRSRRMVLDITRMSGMYSSANLQNMELVIYMMLLSQA